MTATRNGTRRLLGGIVSRKAAQVAAEKATRRLIAELEAADPPGDGRFAHLTEARYWADAVVALAAYDQMFERNP